MMDSQPKTKPKARDQILLLLKTGGPQESGSLAKSLGVSAMAVRQHLYVFQKKRWVEFSENPRPVGRPAKLWRLTETAEPFFPDRHNDLLVNFIEGIQETLGEAQLDRVLEHRAKQQTNHYRARLDACPDLEEKVAKLSEMRSEEGYMAECRELGPEEFLLIENHCPICRAASICSGLCDTELKVFRKSLGNGSRVERIEHMLNEDRRCVYRIRAV